MSQHSRDRVESAGDDKFSRVRLCGEIDATTAPAVAEYLRELPAGIDVELDLSQVRFISAAGLTVLLGLRQQLAQDGAALHLTGVPAFIERILVLVGLREILPYRPVTHTEPVTVLADLLRTVPASPVCGGARARQRYRT